MQHSILSGVILAGVMIAFMLAPNCLFRVKNYEEVRDNVIRDLIENYEDTHKDK